MQEKYKPNEEGIQKNISEMVEKMSQAYEYELLDAFYEGNEEELMDKTSEAMALTSKPLKNAALRVIERVIQDKNFGEKLIMDSSTQAMEDQIAIMNKKGHISILDLINHSFLTDLIDRHGITSEELEQIIERNKEKISDYLG